MKVAKLLYGLSTDQRSVPGEHDDLIIGTQGFFRDHESMAGATLFFLQDEVDSGVRNSLPHQIRFVTDDGVYIRRLNNLCGRSDHVRQQRFSAHLMQNFGMFGFKARPLARSHNGDGYARDVL
jgi:hypothetical protein